MRHIRRPAMPKGRRYTWAHLRFILDWNEGMKRYNRIIDHVEKREAAIGRFRIRSFDLDGLGYLRPEVVGRKWLNFRILWFFFDEIKREEAFLMDSAEGYFLISYEDFWKFLLQGGEVDLLDPKGGVL